MSMTIIKEVVVIALYVLGVPINTHKDLYQAPPFHPQALVRDRIGPGLVGKAVEQDLRLRTYQYRFEGRTLFKGLPCAGATVILHVVTSRINETREVLSGEDGTYQI